MYILLESANWCSYPEDDYSSFNNQFVDDGMVFRSKQEAYETAIKSYQSFVEENWSSPVRKDCFGYPDSFYTDYTITVFELNGGERMKPVFEVNVDCEVKEDKYVYTPKCTYY